MFKFRQYWLHYLAYNLYDVLYDMIQMSVKSHDVIHIQVKVAIRPDTNEDLGHFGDLKPYYIQWIVIGCLEVLWLSFTFALKVPGCPTGYMGPGGLHDSSKYWNCTGGAAAWIDRKFFGYNHIYDEPTSRAVYQVDQFIDGEEGNHHDPEGLLGSINSIVIVFLGLQAGKILLHFTDFKNRMIRFGAWGCKFYLCNFADSKFESRTSLLKTPKTLLSCTDCNSRRTLWL